MTLPGGPLARASWGGTVVVALVAVAGLVDIDTYAPLAVWASVLLFAAGCVLFFVAYAIAVGRSRTDAIGIGGLYFLAGSAPAPVRRSFMASLTIQCLVAVVVIALSPFTSLVMTSMVPMYGIGCAGVWGARHGEFESRRPAVAPSEDEPS